MRISSDPDSIDLLLVHRWIRSAYWSTNIPWESFERACRNCLMYAAFDGDEQVGFARVVTDQSTFAWLCDVFVVDHARGRGIGKQLVAFIMRDGRLQGLRQFLLATKDAHGLYEKFGFRALGDPAGFYMGISRPASELYPAE